MCSVVCVNMIASLHPPLCANTAKVKRKSDLILHDVTAGLVNSQLYFFEEKQDLVLSCSYPCDEENPAVNHDNKCDSGIISGYGEEGKYVFVCIFTVYSEKYNCDHLNKEG